jgi:hypothetical protein
MNIFTADIGEGKAHFYDSDNKTFYGKRNNLELIKLNIPGLKKGDCVVVEEAHLRESHKNTLAQPFSFEQLKELEYNAQVEGIDILVFPQKTTPKARKLAGYDTDSKTDEADTKAIANFLKNDKEAFRCLKPFTPTKLKDYQESNQYIFEFIQQANEDINPAKSSGYGFSGIDYEDEVSKWIKKYAVKGGMTVEGYVPSICEYLDHDEELLSLIGLEFDKKGNLKTLKTPNRIYTIVTSILRPDGSLRLRPDIQKPPLWKFTKAHYFGCKPFHMNQGVSASNYKHWMRRAVSEYKGKFEVGMSFEEYFELKKARAKVDKMTQKIWYALRKMIIEDGLR